MFLTVRPLMTFLTAHDLQECCGKSFVWSNSDTAEQATIPAESVCPCIVFAWAVCPYLCAPCSIIPLNLFEGPSPCTQEFFKATMESCLDYPQKCKAALGYRSGMIEGDNLGSCKVIVPPPLPVCDDLACDHYPFDAVHVCSLPTSL